MSGRSIEAVLTLNASEFTGGMDSAIKQVKSFQSAVNTFSNSGKAFTIVLDSMVTQLNDANLSFSKFESQVKGVESFNKFANGVKALATAIQTLGTDSATASVGITKVIKIVESMGNLFGSSTIKVEGLNTAIRQLIQQENGLSNSTRQTDGAFKQAQQDLMSMVTGLHRYGSVMSDVEAQSRYDAKQMKEHYKSVQEQIKMMSSEFEKAKSEMLSFANTGVEAFNRIGRSVSTVATQTNMLRLPNNSTNLLDSNSKIIQSTELIKQNSIAMQQNGAEILRNMGYTGKLSIEEEQLSQKTQKQTVATDRATQSMNRQATATSRLSRAMSSLKMIGTMVASMMVWNFASSLIKVTRETVNAKSEMNGYFQMLGYTSSEVDHFNKKLDETVKKFPRLNKYALGETISSIGVEFELTTKEMEKAMPVVSMITSEYLRAGRNVNEASLAVKDILQGEFQRLSRETGVKSEQLIEAGWSGDKTDVMGLLKALDKVGKDRNWDKFVAKANSLNDAILILQNRFSEWSADMVEKVQPSIVNAFNQIMVVANDLSKVVNKAMDWIMGDGLGQSIVKWGGLATAIVGVTGAFIHLRTGANLMQMAQMGLTKSIGASILGLEAEQVAQNGLRNSILMTITGLEAEEIADMSRTKVLFASILGLDMATVKEYGFTTALWSSITGVEAETIALEGLNAEMYVSIAVAGAVTGVIIGFTAVLVAQAIQISNTTEKYSKFVNMLEKGDDIISEAKDTVDRLTNSKEALTEKLDTLEKGTYEYEVTANKLKVTQDELNTATDNYADAVNSVAWVKHKQELYDDAKAQAQLDAQKGINEALLDYGFNVQEAEQLSNQYWNDAINGWDEHYKTLQSVNEQYKKNEISVESALQKLKELDDTKISPKEVEVLIRRKISAGNQIANAKEELGNATSLTEYIDKWLWLQVQQVQNALVDFDINNVAGGLTDAIGGLAWGLVHFFGDNFIGQFTQGLARDWGLEGKGSEFGDSIKEGIEIALFGEFELLNGDYWSQLDIDITNALNGFPKWFEDNILKPLSDYVTQFDWVGSATDMFSVAFSQITHIDVIGMLLDALLPEGASASDGSSDHPSFMEDVSNIIGFNIQGWIDSFNADPMGTLGIELPKIDILGLIKGLLPSGDDNGGGFNLGQWLSDLFNIDGVVSYFTTNLSGIISSVTSTASTVGSLFSGLKSTIQGHLTNIVTNVQTGFENAKNYAVTKITGMRDSVNGVITQMTDAWKKMKDSILDSARLIYDGVKKKFDDVKTTLSDFFTKLQNPSSWGSGFQPYSRQPQPLKVRRMLGGSNLHGAGVNPYARTSTKKMSIRDLVDMVGVDEQVNIEQFLALFSGGFGGWSFHEPSKKEVFNKGKEWKTAPPSIQGVGSVGDGYKVARFWDGKPSFTFSEFEQVAQAIFSTIPYKFYYDSEWKGDWVSAFLSGAVNCWDGANALIALAKLFGFDGYPVHTTTKSGVGHFYAMINGKAMDTTNFQHNRSWSPLGGAGIPTRSSHSSRGSVGNSTTQNINITITGDVYGEEDFVSRVREGAREVIREEFNDPLSGVM